MFLIAKRADLPRQLVNLEAQQINSYYSICPHRKSKAGILIEYGNGRVRPANKGPYGKTDYAANAFRDSVDQAGESPLHRLNEWPMLRSFLAIDKVLCCICFSSLSDEIFLMS